MSDVSFDPAVEVFRMYCRSKGLAPKTLEVYFSALQGLRTFLAERGTLPAIPAAADLRAYTVSMMDRGLSRGTIRIRLRSIRVFASFIAREGLLPESPFVGVEIPRVKEEHPRILAREDLARLLQAHDRNTWIGARNLALLTMLADTGVRLNEVLQVDVGDVDLASMSIRIRYGKGGRERLVPVGRVLHRALRRWIEVRGLSNGEHALFVSRSGCRLHRRTVQRIVEEAGKRIGFAGLHAHLMRHSCATLYLQNGGNVFALRQLLGHSSLSTTQRYVHMVGTALIEAHGRASPVDRLLSGS